MLVDLDVVDPGGRRFEGDGSTGPEGVVVGIEGGLVAGILCLRRSHWRWALAGTVAAALSMLLLGLPAVVLVALAKNEFE